MIKKIIYALFIGLVIIACSSSDDNNGNNGNNGDGFDRTALLTNYADNIIIPTFQDLDSKLSALDVARGNFVNTQTESNLNLLSNAWLNAYRVWQHAEMYNIGFAETITNLTPEQDQNRGFVRYFNIYPVSESEIDGYATTGNHDLTDALTDQGFPALDYLIHGIASGDATPIDKFTTNANANGYITYMQDVIARMRTITTQIINDWQSSYKTIFIAATENGTSGSINKIANDFVFTYEKGFRAQKVGTPAGIFSAGQTFPDKVEAYYKENVSKTLALEALNAIENFFMGKAYNGTTTGSSIQSYLQFLQASEVDTEISNQFTAVRNAINGLDENFSEEITTNNTQVLAVYEVMQAMVPLFKVDMRQALDFTLDFNDSDGD